MFILTPEERVRHCYYESRLADEVLSKEKTEEESFIDVKNLSMYARLTWERPDNPKFPRLLRYVTVPTSIIWGKEDAVLPVEHGYFLKENIANSQLHILSACGHVPHVEKTEECLDIINEFLK
jgi:pimeloyl-ACP methyl ester carboxylesterase